jgi:acyl carrier protein
MRTPARGITGETMSFPPDADISRELLFERLKAIFRDHLKIEEPSLIRPESDIQEDLGVRSLDLVDLIIAVEEEFQIRVEASFSDIRTVDDVIQYLLARLHS